MVYGWKIIKLKNEYRWKNGMENMIGVISIFRFSSYNKQPIVLGEHICQMILCVIYR